MIIKVKGLGKTDIDQLIQRKFIFLFPILILSKLLRTISENNLQGLSLFRLLRLSNRCLGKRPVQ